jgi:hypothetical protein
MVPRVGECTCGPGGYERVEMRRGEVRKRTDVPLHLGEFSHNNNMHSLTQQTPFMLDTRRHLRMGFEPHLESVNEFKEHMAQGLDKAKSAIAKAKDKYAMYYNRR